MIDEVFGAEGLLAAKFPGYAPRKGQIDMARAIERAIASQQHVVAEGPTGTGKSLAYLVPSIAHATAQKKKKGAVIVVTANIALQEQLVSKDLPLLRDILPTQFSFGMMKGKNNYVCVDALGKVLSESLMSSGDRMLTRLVEWAQTTETGDVSEFPETPPPALWRRLAVGSDECKGQGCKWMGSCFSEKAKRAAWSADVVVTNYHMFFAHLRVREKMRQLKQAGAPVEVDVVLPPASVVIFDEAHKAADIARDFLGFQVTRGQIDWLLRGFNHDVAREATTAATRFFAALLELKKSRKYRARLRSGTDVQELHGIELADAMDRVGAFYEESIKAAAWSDDEKSELQVRARRSRTIAGQLREAMSPGDRDGIVYFIEETFSKTGPSATLKSKPIKVDDFLREELFGQYSTVVLTSATLATGGSGQPFDFVRKEMGLDGGADIVAESPFRWEEQAMLVVPRTMTNPKDMETFPGAVAKHVRDVARAAGGRTLGLFTSFKNMDTAYRACEGLPYRVLKQNDAPRTKLVEEFKRDVTSILLGCESFWAGVDVPGEALSCVVIDRLPFPTPDDPIVDAIAEQDRNWFFTYAIPRAIIAMKQGIGRLIRATTDRGVVVVLDRRLTTMSYGRAFLKALPAMRMADEVEDVAAFFDREPSARAS